MKPPCVMLKQLDYFVGREKTLLEIEQCLNDTGYLYLDFLEGVEGMGKTTFLVKLYADLKEQKQYNPVWVCMTVFDPSRKGAGKDKSSLIHLTANLDDYRRFLSELAAEFSDNAFAGFEACIDESFASTISDLIKKHGQLDLGGVTIKTGDIHMGAFTRLADGTFKTGDVIVNVPDNNIRMAIDHLRSVLTREFVQRFNKLGSDSRRVLLIDNFHLVLDDVLGQWFLSEITPQLDNTVVVFAKTKTSQELQPLQNSVVLGLENFSLEEVGIYLGKRLKKFSDLPQDLPGVIFRYTGGHPQAVALAADLCESLSKAGKNGKDFLAIFTDIPREPAGKMIKLVDKIKESINDDAVLKALEIGWVLRRFDAGILRALLKADSKEIDDDQVGKYQDIISRLEEYSFTENHEEFYKFHDFISHAMEERLKKNDPKRYALIHHCAASYYSEKLIEYDKDRKDESSYLRWYRYESYEWQVLIAEWLYHLKNSPERALARFTFLKVYFDAFWWWGAYESFPFCERLLSEWRNSQTCDEDKDWFRHVQNFHNSYPTGYQKRGRGNWAQVQTSLSCLRQLGGFDGKPAGLDAEHRHLRGITDFFLSQAYFYQELKDPRAEDCLKEALAIFEDKKDDWNTAWVLYYLADLYMNWADKDKALAFSDRALQLGLAAGSDKRDYEICGNVHRVLADTYWQAGAMEKSFRHYACAIAATYLYHAIPSPADLYTRSLQREMMERTIARLKELADRGGQAEALEFAQFLWNFFAPYWKLNGKQNSPQPSEITKLLENNQSTVLMEMLFPRLPRDEELNCRGLEYTDQGRCLLESFTLQMEKEAQGICLQQ